MSRSRFASITADLLVRKGEAKPWHVTLAAEAPPAVMVQPEPPRLVREPVEQESIEHETIEHESIEHRPPAPAVCGPVRRCAIRLTECEYQRLGILAVKKDVTRQHILREAVDAYLETAERDYGRGCGCLSGETGIR